MRIDSMRPSFDKLACRASARTGDAYIGTPPVILSLSKDRRI